MKHLAKSVALLLAVLMMLSVFAACSGQTPTATPSETPAETPAETPVEKPAETPAEEPAETPAETPAEAPTETPTETPAEAPDVAEPTADYVTVAPYGYAYTIPQIAIDGVALPIANNNETLSVFRQWTSSYVTNYDDIWAIQEVGRRTGVDIDYVTVSTPDQVQIMFVSQDYTDMIKSNPTTYNGGIDKAIEDEVYIDAEELFAYTPVFTAWLGANEEYARECKTDNGAYYFNSVQSGREPAWCAAVVRGDWLDDVGLDAPKTYDDWYEMLTAFKEVKNASMPLSIGYLGYETMGYSLTAGYNVAPEWYQVDGVAHYGMLEEGMREYITMMHKWYSEKLVNQDFPGANPGGPFVEGIQQLTTGTTGAWDWASYSHIDLWPRMNNGEGYVLPVTNPTKTEGETTHLRRNNQMSGNNCFFVTTAAVERGVEELCAKWIDYHYTQDCAYVMTFGEEGVDWNFGEDGFPHYTDVYFNNEEGTTVYGEKKFSVLNSSYYIWWREFDHKSESAMNAYSLWQNSSDAAYNWPDGTALTAEESEAYSSPYGDIQTYVQENIPRFIIGERPLNEWDAFVAELYNFGIADLIQIKQDSLDRYYAR